MQKNEIFEYYIDDDEAFQAKLSFMINADLISHWEEFLNKPILFVGEVDNRLILANKIAHNKKDIQVYDVLSNDDIHQKDFKLLSFLTFQEASMVDILKMEDGECFYQSEKAREYILKYKPD